MQEILQGKDDRNNFAWSQLMHLLCVTSVSQGQRTMYLQEDTESLVEFLVILTNITSFFFFFNSLYCYPSIMTFLVSEEDMCFKWKANSFPGGLWQVEAPLVDKKGVSDYPAP